MGSGFCPLRSLLRVRRNRLLFQEDFPGGFSEFPGGWPILPLRRVLSAAFLPTGPEIVRKGDELIFLRRCPARRTAAPATIGTPRHVGVGTQSLTFTLCRQFGQPCSLWHVCVRGQRVETTGWEWRRGKGMDQCSMTLSALIKTLVRLRVTLWVD